MTAEGSGDGWFFDRVAPLYDLFVPAVDEAALERALAVAEGPVERILDVGGGTGRVARTLPGAVVVDASRPMLRRARSRGLPTVQGDAARLPVRDGAVDAVVVVDALHHFPDAAGAASAAARALRPGGVLVVVEFDPTTVRGRALVLAEHLAGFASTFRPPGAVATLLSEAGLTPRVVDRGFGYTVVGRAGAEPGA